MKKALGHLAVALAVGAIWPFMAGGDRNLTTVVLALILVVALYLAVAGLSALLQPLGRAVKEALFPRLPQKLWRMPTS